MAVGQSGSAIIYILVAVALAGALTFAMTRSSQTGQGTLSQHQARQMAQEILDFGWSVERAVDRLRRNGCSENELSFEHSGNPGDIPNASYNNIETPLDGRCRIFHVNGGKLHPPQKPIASHRNAYDFRFPATGYAINSPAAPDIVLYTVTNNINVCLEYNRIIGNGMPVSFGQLGKNNPCAAHYNGRNTLVMCQQPHCGVFPTNCAPYQLNRNGCFIRDNDAEYMIYYTVLVR